MGAGDLSEADERIVESFLRVYAAREHFDAEAARNLLVEMYPELATRIEIVAEGERHVLVRR